MGTRAVKTPNGLYSRYSDIVDNFTHTNYDREELFDVFADEYGIDVASRKMDRADAEPDRFESEIRGIAALQGPLEAERMRAWLSASDVTGLLSPPSFGDPVTDPMAEATDYIRHLELLNDDNDDDGMMRERYSRKIVNFILEANKMEVHEV